MFAATEAYTAGSGDEEERVSSMPKPERKPKRQMVDRENLPEALHVALRKLCDSTPTIILWNLIHKLDEGTWGLYLDHVWLELQLAMAASKETLLWACLKRASLEFEDTVRRKRLDKLDFYGLRIMDSVFELFSDGDWQGYAGYLEEAE